MTDPEVNIRSHEAKIGPIQNEYETFIECEKGLVRVLSRSKNQKLNALFFPPGRHDNPEIELEVESNEKITSKHVEELLPSVTKELIRGGKI